MHLTRATTLALTLTAACSFEPRGLGGLGDPDSGTVGDPDGGNQPSPDATPLEDVHHVALAQEYLGSEDVRISDTVTIDTTQLSVSAGGPAALVPMQAQPDGSGPELAIIHVRDLVIDGTLRATGSRPLVILARTIRIDGLLDVGARRGTPGAGGSGPGSGDGRGGDGQRHGTFFDTGGGGGGFARDGGLGGNDGAGDGARGRSYGDAMLTALVGGSGGGSSDGDCSEGPAGAGGGAVQLYASVTIAIGDDGGINAGGGGGSPGHGCFGQYTAGRGGGSGGAIYLQSPSVVLDGTLAANGGGGGGAAAFNNGDAGADGRLGDSPAAGGAKGGGDYGADGGDGGTESDPENGDDNDGDGNGGGGGGAGGRIVVRARSAQLGGTVSPTAVVSP